MPISFRSQAQHADADTFLYISDNEQWLDEPPTGTIGFAPPYFVRSSAPHANYRFLFPIPQGLR